MFISTPKLKIDKYLTVYIIDIQCRIKSLPYIKIKENGVVILFQGDSFTFRWD